VSTGSRTSTYRPVGNRTIRPVSAPCSATLPVAALVATIVAGPQSLHRVSPGAVVVAAGLALFLPVIPYALELLALRRLGVAAFGTLMGV
jgi:inner membrane transporter RhtA